MTAKRACCTEQEDISGIRLPVWLDDAGRRSSCRLSAGACAYVYRLAAAIWSRGCRLRKGSQRQLARGVRPLSAATGQ